MLEIKSEEGLSKVEPSQRVLLLSHCLRPSQTCPGKFNKAGLQCPEDCAESCVLQSFREAAARVGYSGVCIAAGGAMALRFVKEHHPRGIVAVACGRELGEGVEGVKEMMNGSTEPPAIVVVPLCTDGCVDTKVDADQVLRVINMNASSLPSNG